MQDSKDILPLEAVAVMPSPGMNFPVNVSFSPDGQCISYLHAKQHNELTRQLYYMDINKKSTALLANPPGQGDTEVNLSKEEKLRRERQRQMGLGITSYSWCPKLQSKKILCHIQGDIYIQEKIDAPLKLLFDKNTTGENVNGGAIDPQFSPDGKWIAFVQDYEVYVIPSSLLEDEQPRSAQQVTYGAREIDGLSNGLACFLTQEELSRFRGFWWSPDSTQIAFEQVDESMIPKFRIMHSGAATTGESAQEDHRYPFAGQVNPTRRLGVITVINASGELIREPVDPIWMDLKSQDCSDFYISRVNWFPDCSLSIQKLNRLQTEVFLLKSDPNTGMTIELIHETHDIWINTNYLFRNIDIIRPTSPTSEVPNRKDQFRFIWASERTGFMHLYLYEFIAQRRTAECLRAITSGQWVVESIDGVDLLNQLLYFSGTLESPLERHLYVTSLDSEAEYLHSPVRLTESQGFHIITMDPGCQHFVDLSSCLTNAPNAYVYPVPPILSLVSQSDSVESKFSRIFAYCKEHAIPLYNDADPRVTHLISRNKLTPPKMISFPTRDGKETLFGAMYLPDASIYGPGPYPTLISVYGGPHVQRVAHMWSMTVDIRAQRFRDMGYLVLKVDNRGSYRRGLAFEGEIKHRMGTIEVLDQQDGINRLIQENLTIPDRVGIYGWSYGGYMSAIALMKAADTFKLAIAGAPVTSWDGYDTCYTERYMSTPQLNPMGYTEGSVMEAVHRMRPNQKLLLIHGLIDENVHFRHTARLISALISARKPYDLLLFPSERHGPRKLEDRIYMEQRISEYVVQHL